MGIDDYIDTVAPAPDWLKNAWAESKKNGTDKLTMREIDAIIAEDRGAVSSGKRLGVAARFSARYSPSDKQGL